MHDGRICRSQGGLHQLPGPRIGRPVIDIPLIPLRPPPTPVPLDNTRLAQHAQLLGNVGLWTAQGLLECADTFLSTPQHIDDAQPRRQRQEVQQLGYILLGRSV